MKQVEMFSLIAINSEAEPPEQCYSELLVNGNKTGLIIWGAALEAAVHVYGKRYVLFLTDGLLYENALTIYLIDLVKGVLDEIHIGQPYADGYFENLKIDPDSIHFKFLGEILWELKVYSHPVLRNQLIKTRYVKRKFGIKTYFNIMANNNSSELI